MNAPVNAGGFHSIRVTYLKITEVSIMNMLEEGSYDRDTTTCTHILVVLLLITHKTDTFTYENDPTNKLLNAIYM